MTISMGIVCFLMIVYFMSLSIETSRALGVCRNLEVKNYDKQNESMYMYFAMHED
jgi:hypothetical protein